MQIAAICLIEVLLIYLATRKRDEIWLNLLIALNMIAILVCGTGITDYGIGHSNIGNIFYGVILSTVALIFYLFNQIEAQKTIRYAVFVLVGFVALRFFSLQFQQPDLASPSYAAHAVVLNDIMRVFIPSLVSFAVAASVLVLGLSKLPFHKAWNYLLAITVAEILDSAIFFYAFIGVFDLSEFLVFAETGFVVKSGIHAAFLPLLLYLTHGKSHTQN